VTSPVLDVESLFEIQRHTDVPVSIWHASLGIRHPLQKYISTSSTIYSKLLTSQLSSTLAPSGPKVSIIASTCSPAITVLYSIPTRLAISLLVRSFMS
jgi:hypothetical protein